MGAAIRVLAIETSCDETAAAVVVRHPSGRFEVESSVVTSQIDLHALFGGVVPEIASRAHVELLPAALRQAMDEASVEAKQLDAVVATVGPGLIGALLVGVASAKALALAWDKPFVGVNHLEAHLFAPLVESVALAEAAAREPAGTPFPLVVLLVSGGHTLLIEVLGPGSYRLLGQTLDDAAGEAFDKVARYLGLGYPGGPVIDRLASEGDCAAIAFPRSMRGDGFDFSFSGLKTSVVNHVRRHPEVVAADVCASFQEAVVDVLIEKTLRAVKEVGALGVAIGGGVAANSRLRQQISERGEALGLAVHLPSLALCTDNAAMIGAAGAWAFAMGRRWSLASGADPNLRIDFGGNRSRRQ